MNALPDFEDWLEEWFIANGEYDGTPVTKDNCEDLFERWIEDHSDWDSIVKWVDLYGQYKFSEGKKEGLVQASNIIKIN